MQDFDHAPKVILGAATAATRLRLASVKEQGKVMEHCDFGICFMLTKFHLTSHHCYYAPLRIQDFPSPLSNVDSEIAIVWMKVVFNPRTHGRVQLLVGHGKTADFDLEFYGNPKSDGATSPLLG